MARTKSTKEPVEKALNPQDQPERFKLGEISSSGLSIFSGITQEELKQELNPPNNFTTYKLMSYHPTVNAALTLYSMMIAKANYRIVPPKNPSEAEKKQAEIIHQMLFEDMEKPFEDVVQDALTMTTYGFSVCEKVYRKRNKSSGSLFNDDLIAPKKIALRQQHSIDKFIFSDDGNEIKGVKQTIISDNINRYSRRPNTIVIPRSKFLLFTAGVSSDNPYGISPLRNVYLPWKYLSAIEELEAISVQKELHGIPFLRIPAQYMSSEASAEQKATYENIKNIARNLQSGSQAGIVLPSTVDPETRERLFDIELLSTDGKKAYDLTDIKEYYRNLVFIGLHADVLQMGTTNTGSFALAGVKNTLTGNTVESYLKRIIRVMNEDLILQIYELNGWSTQRMCKIDYENLSEIDVDSYSKSVQRIAAVGLLPKTLDVINRNLDMLGVDRLTDDTTEEELSSLLSENKSRSGDSFDTASGGLNGTSDQVASDDTSSLNQDNAA